MEFCRLEGKWKWILNCDQRKWRCSQKVLCSQKVIFVLGSAKSDANFCLMFTESRNELCIMITIVLSKIELNWIEFCIGPKESESDIYMCKRASLCYSWIHWKNWKMHMCRVRTEFMSSSNMWPDNWKRMWKNSPIDQDNVVTSNLVLWILDFLASLSAIETEQMGGMSPLCILEKAEPGETYMHNKPTAS